MTDFLHSEASDLDLGVVASGNGVPPIFDGEVPAGAADHREITPSYLAQEGQFWTSEVRRILNGHVGKKSINRIANSIKRPQNGLFNQLVRHVYDAERQTYLCFSSDLLLPAKHQGPVASAIEGGWHEFQRQFAFFANPLSFCTQQDGHYRGPSPMLRVVNSGVVVFTVEWDVPQTDFLDEQIQWTIAGSDQKCRLDHLYTKLSRLWDFRWLEAVWSGHKSLHLHFLLDSRHLNPQRFSGEFPRPLGLFDSIPDPLFRAGLMRCYEELTPIVRDELGLDIEPDPRLREPDRYRRNPWGVRTLDGDNIFRVRADTKVPQVVLFSRGRSYARAGDEWLLRPDLFPEAEKRSRRSDRRPPRVCFEDLEVEVADGFLDELSALCERLFGPKEHAPSPVSVDKGPNGWRIRFLNNTFDRNPGSVMEGHHYTILIGSQDPEIRSKRYAFPLSADQLVDRFVEKGSLLTRLPASAPHWSEIQFQQALQWFNSEDPEEFDSTENPSSPWGLSRPRPPVSGRVCSIPDFLLAANIQEAADHQRALIQSMPGAGKTASLLRKMVEEDFDPDRRGFRVVACSSYDQASEKLHGFQREFGDACRAGLVRGFNDVYKAVCPSKRLAIEDAAKIGCRSVVEAAYTGDNEIAVKLDEYRQEMQHGLGFTDDGELDYRLRDKTVIFCVHSVVHKWSWRGGTKNWLHPLFHAWIEARAAGRFEDVKSIQRVIDHDMRLAWVLYDEVAMSDLIVHHPRQQVDYVRAFIEATKRFRDLDLEELLKAWTAYKSSKPSSVSFDLMREIAHAGYHPGHLIKLDPAREPYGINNKEGGLYTAAKGQEHYGKTQDWWDHLGCRLTVTTTELKPRYALQKIATEQQARNARERTRAVERGISWKPRPSWATFTYDPADYMPAEQMRAKVYLDRRARAPRDGQPDFECVSTIHEEIRNADPDAWIVSNLLEGDHVITPRKAKGSNNFVGQRIYYIMMFLAGARYEDLLMENEVLGLDCAVQLEYLDEFDQIAGRTLGFRYRPGSEFIAVVSPRLWTPGLPHTVSGKPVSHRAGRNPPLVNSASSKTRSGGLGCPATGTHARIKLHLSPVH